MIREWFFGNPNKRKPEDTFDQVEKRRYIIQEIQSQLKRKHDTDEYVQPNKRNYHITYTMIHPYSFPQEFAMSRYLRYLCTYGVDTYEKSQILLTLLENTREQQYVQFIAETISNMVGSQWWMIENCSNMIPMQA